MVSKWRFRVWYFCDEICVDEAIFEAWFAPASFSPMSFIPLKKRFITYSKDLEGAVKACEAYAKKVLGHELYLQWAETFGLAWALGWHCRRLSRSSRWRKQPATPNQKNYITKRWKKQIEISPSETSNKIASLTKGEAANMYVSLHFYSATITNSLKVSHA